MITIAVPMDLATTPLREGPAHVRFAERLRSTASSTMPQLLLADLLLEASVSPAAALVAADPRSAPPCEALFARLAEERPSELIAILGSGQLTSADLTFAAEAAGRVADSALAVPALLRLLLHPAPVVREGAVYGLAGHLTLKVRAALEQLVRDDPSPGVREAAQDVLASQSITT